MRAKKKVLVVDYNYNFNQLLRCALEDDFTIFTASDGFEGAKKAAQILPDIILMDIMMPSNSGLKMARMLTAEEDTRNIPIIALTSAHPDKGAPQLFGHPGNIRHILSKTIPLMEIVGIAKKFLCPA